ARAPRGAAAGAGDRRARFAAPGFGERAAAVTMGGRVLLRRAGAVGPARPRPRPRPDAGVGRLSPLAARARDGPRPDRLRRRPVPPAHSRANRARRRGAVHDRRARRRRVRPAAVVALAGSAGGEGGRRGWSRWRGGLGAGVDFVHVTPESTDHAVTLTAVHWSTTFVASAAV